MNTLSLLSGIDIQEALKDYLVSKRKAQKLSRKQLAQNSTVPASTIKKFETTGQISLRQFLLVWQSLDDLARIKELTKEISKDAYEPRTIQEVLKG
jgi:ribosome-binding protein aMBF1 (putative translation factor)